MAICQRRSRQPRPVEGDVGHRALPHGGARGPCRALRELLAHHHRLQLLPQSALPEVPGRGGSGMAGGARGRAAAGAVLSRGFHAAGSDRRHRLSEQGRHLRPAVQGIVRDHAHNRRRSQASRRSHRHLVRPAHLGLGTDPPPACAHDRARRRLLARWQELDLMPTTLLPVSGSVVSLVSRLVAGQARAALIRRGRCSSSASMRG